MPVLGKLKLTVVVLMPIAISWACLECQTTNHRKGNPVDVGLGMIRLRWTFGAINYFANRVGEAVIDGTRIKLLYFVCFFCMLEISHP